MVVVCGVRGNMGAYRINVNERAIEWEALHSHGVPCLPRGSPFTGRLPNHKW